MQRLLIVLLFVSGFAFASAQQNWFGVRTGYPLGGTVHYGIENGLSNGFDLRLSANLKVRGNDVDFGIGVDGLNEIYIDNPIIVYVGGGPSLDFNGNSALIDVHALGGLEFRFSDFGLSNFGIFVEASLGAGIGINRNSQIPSTGAAVGLNIHF